MPPRPVHDPLFSVAGRIVVITGGLGQLGDAMSRAFIRRGAKVVVIDQAACERRRDPQRLVVPADVTVRPDLEDALRLVTGEWGLPDVLINAAALDSPPNASAEENGPFEDYPASSWDQVMAVNVKGVMLACQVFGGAMASAGRGAIINVSSIYGKVSPDQELYAYRRRDGAPFYKPAAYSASKSALLNLTRYLATYWAKANVRVNTLTLAGVFNQQDPAFLEGYCRRIPIGRMAQDADYQGAVLFLASDASQYMTGADLVVDGGWTAL